MDLLSAPKQFIRIFVDGTPVGILGIFCDYPSDLNKHGFLIFFFKGHSDPTNVDFENNS